MRVLPELTIPKLSKQFMKRYVIRKVSLMTPTPRHIDPFYTLPLYFKFILTI